MRYTQNCYLITLYTNNNLVYYVVYVYLICIIEYLLLLLHNI